LYGIFSEDKSDFETLKVLIQRLAIDEKIQFCGKGFNGCGELLKHAWRNLKSQADMGCTRFVIAHDADQRDFRDVQRDLVDKIIKPSGIKKSICLLVPVQEIEAWLLADVCAASNLFKGWMPKPEPNPESIARPKEYLEKLSRVASGSPRYRHAMHNPQLAKHIDLVKVSKSCPSFRPLETFVKCGKSNY